MIGGSSGCGLHPWSYSEKVGGYEHLVYSQIESATEAFTSSLDVVCSPVSSLRLKSAPCSDRPGLNVVILKEKNLL